MAPIWTTNAASGSPMSMESGRSTICTAGRTISTVWATVVNPGALAVTITVPSESSLACT